MDEIRKNIEGLTEKLRQYSAKAEYCSLDDNFLLHFSYETESYIPDFIYPEYGLKCKLDDCWVDTVKILIRNAGEN